MRVANYVARYEREYLREHLDWLAQPLERFLETGKLRKCAWWALAIEFGLLC